MTDERISIPNFFNRFLNVYEEDPNTKCWNWSGPKNKMGYGKLGVHYAHRLSLAIRSQSLIPKKQCVCHKCDNPSCINPEHLFLGSQKDNMRDMMEKGRHRNQNFNKQFCKNGHELAEANIRIEITGFRRCQICRRKYEKEWRKNARIKSLSANR